jgi:Short C-terminal domain
MKTYMLVILLLATFQGFSQKKKKEDPKDIKIDSLSKANSTLSVQLDSISKDHKLYYGLYTTIKEKVVLHDFDPAQMPQIIDSLRAGRDATFAGLTAASESLNDSLTMLSQENKSLKAKLDSLAVAGGGDKSQLIAELKQLKELLDAKILTQAEYDAKKEIVMAKWQ